MIPPAMTWKRSWTIIRKVQANLVPQTPGYQKYLRSEIARMDIFQKRRFIEETKEVTA